MKKLMTLMIGLTFLTTTVALTYAQGTQKQPTTKKKKNRNGKANTTKQ